jgi:hypothetical protein
MIDRYVIPRIGRVPLRCLTITDLEDLYADLCRRPPFKMANAGDRRGAAPVQ